MKLLFSDLYYSFMISPSQHERSYQGYCTRSRPIAEVKLLRARPVVRWVTTCEARVLFVFSLNPLFVKLVSHNWTFKNRTFFELVF